VNSLRRPRRRPRVTSVCFRSFFYVLIREAFVVTLNVPTASRPDSALRYELMRADDASVRRRWETLCLRQRVDGRAMKCPVHGTCNGCGATRAHRIGAR
jgi:hypothetical protein